VKKKRDAPITKNIAAVFRRDNVIEYKGPGGYISEADFNKTLAYCYLYASIHRLSVTELSLTIAGTGYPRELARHIRKVYRWEVREAEPGIHRVSGSGMAFPVQFIEGRKLREEENRWITGLRRNLSAGSMAELLRESVSRRDDSLMKAYLQVILAANPKTVQEVWNMSDITLDEFLEEAGFIAKWKAQGEAQGLAQGLAQGVKKALELLRGGKTPDEILQMYDVQETASDRD
jgi:hypothetical protein